MDAQYRLITIGSILKEDQAQRRGGANGIHGGAVFTWLTPPEFPVHMANLLASPTVSPSKSLPLWRRESQTSGPRRSET